VLIEGRVSLRDENVQISCKKASRYQPGQVPQNNTPLTEVRPSVVSNGKGVYQPRPAPAAVVRPVTVAAAGATTAAASAPTPIATQPQRPSQRPSQRHRLVISLTGTADEEGDSRRLHRIIYAVREYQGRDEVSLRIVNNGKTVNLKLPSIYTGYCQELHDKLVELVGASGLKVEPLPGEV
jgi:hypothetical protein